jgi:hypothetical protein
MHATMIVLKATRAGGRFASEQGADGLGQDTQPSRPARPFSTHSLAAHMGHCSGRRLTAIP